MTKCVKCRVGHLSKWFQKNSPLVFKCSYCGTLLSKEEYEKLSELEGEG